MGSGYRYGFNGKERDIVGLGGGGSTYDYGFRIYNPQLGKFLSVDPLTDQFPFFSPYHYASNNPIFNIDIDGLEGRGYRNPGTARNNYQMMQNYRIIIRNQQVSQAYRFNRNSRANQGPRSERLPDYAIKPSRAGEFLFTITDLVDHYSSDIKEKYSVSLRVEEHSRNSINYAGIKQNFATYFVFSGTDLLELEQKEANYQNKFNELFEEKMNELSMEKMNKSYASMATDERNSFVTDNSFEVAARRFQVSIKLGPSPKQQVINQVNQMIRDGDIEIDEGTTEAKELPVIYPSLQK